MNKEKIFHAIGNISEEKIDAAYEFRQKKTFRYSAMKLGSVAAALLVVLGGGIWGWNQIKKISLNKSENREEIVEVKKWEEKSLAEQYTKVIYDGVTYTYTGNVAEKQNIGDCFGECTAQGVDEAHNVHETTCKIYEIKNISDICAIAAEFNSNFYIYINYNYQPQSLNDFITDLNMENSLKILNCTIQEVLGEQEHYIYADNTVVLTVLLKEGNTSNIGDEYWDIIERSSEQYRLIADIAVSLHAVGVENVTISLDSLGYISSNIMGTAKAFYIGEEKILDTIEVLRKNGIKTEKNLFENTDVMGDIIVPE